MDLPLPAHLLRVAFKRGLYSMLYVRDAVQVMFGRTKPLLQFKVEASPPSVYFNFEIAPARIDALQKELDLPFPLTKIRCLEDDAPFYCLTLNIYRVSGLATGIRAEWSVYIQDAEGKPRYLVLEAQSDNPSVDSVNLITLGGDVRHTQKEDSIASTALAADGGRFTARLRLPKRARKASAAAEWIEANDYIYWMDGMCDRTFYDSGLANADMRLVPPARIKIEDSTRWGSLVLPKPKHVVVFQNEIEFSISPWWNLDS